MTITIVSLALLSAGGGNAAPLPIVTPYAVRSGGLVELRAEVRAAADATFAIGGAAGGAPELVLATGLTGSTGTAQVHLATLPAPRFDALSGIELRALTRDRSSGQVVSGPTAALGSQVALCERLSFNVSPEGEMQTGEIVDDQYASAGLTISGINNGGAGPDEVIIFDSSNPTGGDDDLQTPGFGPGNNTALGNLLIIAEDVVDIDGDGLVDDPDDAEAGGRIIFEFEDPVRMCRLGLVDLDKGGIGSRIFFYDEANMLIEEFELPSMGNNSFQEIEFDARGVSRAEVALVSSGAVPFIDFVPCPTTVDFEDNSFGLDLELQAGEIVSGPGLAEAAGLPFGLAAQNLGAGPDAAILFDTDDPTGGDFDLGQAEEGLVLILAEDLIDLDGDGLVDDPDDEAGGGILTVEFPNPVILQSVTVLDIDLDEIASLESYDDSGNLVDVTSLAPLGDGSTQTVEPDVANVSRLQLTMSGSGALAGFVVCPIE